MNATPCQYGTQINPSLAIAVNFLTQKNYVYKSAQNHQTELFQAKSFLIKNKTNTAQIVLMNQKAAFAQQMHAQINASLP
ncbi:hypothetical protein ACWJKU_11735 [Methylocaldum sp. MU1018]